MDSLCKRYAGKKPDGVYALGYDVGVLFFFPMEEDKIDCDYVTAWEYAGKRSNYRRQQVSTTRSGKMYLRKGRHRIYLDEVMRSS